MIWLRNCLGVEVSGVRAEFVTLRNVEILDFLELPSCRKVLQGVFLEEAAVSF